MRIKCELQLTFADPTNLRFSSRFLILSGYSLNTMAGFIPTIEVCARALRLAQMHAQKTETFLILKPSGQLFSDHFISNRAKSSGVQRTAIWGRPCLANSKLIAWHCSSPTGLSRDRPFSLVSAVFITLADSFLASLGASRLPCHVRMHSRASDGQLNPYPAALK